MSVLKHHRRGPGFTTIYNDVLDTLSIEQTGLLVKLLRRPPGWEFTCQNLADETGEGLHRIRRIRAELQQLGYLRTVNLRSAGGHLRRETWVRESLDVPWPDEADRDATSPSSVLADLGETRADEKDGTSTKKDLKKHAHQHHADADASAGNDVAWAIARRLEREGAMPALTKHQRWQASRVAMALHGNDPTAIERLYLTASRDTDAENGTAWTRSLMVHLGVDEQGYHHIAETGVAA